MPRETTPLISPVASGQAPGHALRRTRWRATCVLPVVVVTYFMAYFAPVLELNPYIYDRVAKQYDFKYNTTSQHPCANDTVNGTMREIQDKIQKRVSTIELYLVLCNYLLAAIPVMMLGPLTDRYGRKVGFLFPICGTLCKLIVYILVVTKDLSLEVLFIGHICEAIGGSFAAMLMTMYGVISDVTVPGQQRSYRITVMDAVQTFAGSIAQISLGKWLKYSYFHPLLFGLAMVLVSFLSVVFALPETAYFRDLVETTAGQQVNACVRFLNTLMEVVGTCYKMLKRSVLIYFRDETAHGRLAKRRLAFIVFVLTAAVNFSKPGVLGLYVMKYPLCWGATKSYIVFGVCMVCTWIAILILLALLQRVFKMEDRQVAILGAVSGMLSALFLSLATNDVMVYEMAALGFMIRVTIPMIRSIISSVVDKCDQGAAYASMACIETIGASAFSAMANRIYYATLTTFAGAIFAIFACINLVAIVLLVLLNVMFAREHKVQDGQSPRNNSRDGNIQEEPDPSW